MKAVSIGLSATLLLHSSLSPVKFGLFCLATRPTSPRASPPSFKGPYRPEQGSEGEEDVKRGSIDRPQCNVPKGELSA